MSPWPLGSAPTFQNSATHRFDGEMSRGPTGLRSCLCDGLYDTRKSVDLATLFSVNFPRNPLRFHYFDIITVAHDGVVGLVVPS